MNKDCASFLYEWRLCSLKSILSFPECSDVVRFGSCGFHCWVACLFVFLCLDWWWDCGHSYLLENWGGGRVIEFLLPSGRGAWMLICISKLMNVCRALWDAQMKGSGEAQRYYYCHLLIKMFPPPPPWLFFKALQIGIGFWRELLTPSQQAAAIFQRRESHSLFFLTFAFLSGTGGRSARN